MRLTVTFQGPDFTPFVRLPLHYNYCVQSFIYRHISQHLASFLHNKGYRYEKRSFKLFTFSRIFGKYKIEKETIIFNFPFKFYISSPVEDFVQEFAETLARSKEVSIANNHLFISSIEVHFSPNFTSPVLIKMLSPITIYSTLLTSNGKKKTYFYSPFEDEFSKLIQKNILKKYISFYQKKPSSEKFKISPVQVNKNSKKLVKYTPKNSPYTLIKGWMGEYKLEGNPELISFAYDAGIGAKNSQGFGMFEIIQALDLT